MQRNRHIASILSEFFPLKWLLESTSVLQDVGATKLGVKSFKDCISSFLGLIELYLTFQGLTILHLPANTQKVIENKSWSICRVLSQKNVAI
ncbi:MAG: hypothetical protein ACXADY_07085 [Candidatus Hodarchaeales archaeon]